MKLIPVIDLMAGLVVHARRGERENYRPISSTLCPSAAPEAILQALIERYACDTIYIADLDAIRFRRPQLALIEQLRTRFPQINIWLDIGIAEHENFLSASHLELGKLVIGSESVLDSTWLNDLDQDGWILSLDFKHGDFLGPKELLENASIWPRRMLAMNLAHVGSGLGPDFTLLENLKYRRRDCELYAAGGVRNSADLVELKQRGIAGALVATALHDGSIERADLSWR
jgi:phosphoribosylformimino-5-aminoimidazole carboxamide ribotide isomerase